MALNLWEFIRGFRIKPTATTTIDAAGEMEVLSTDSNKVHYHNGTTKSAVVTEAHTATLTNKTFDADGTGNVLSNIDNANIKAAAAIAVDKLAALTASRATATDSSGFLTSSATTSTELGYVNGVTSAIQTQLNTGSSNLSTHESDTSTHGVGVIVGTTESQTLTNKTLTAPIISTISNTGTLTLPTSTDTLVGRATTDTLTNKTLTSPVISTISNTGTLTLPTSTDTLVGRATTDTLTNKTISSPVITTGSMTGTSLDACDYNGVDSGFVLHNGGAQDKLLQFNVDGSAGSTVLKTAGGGQIITLPAVTGTLSTLAGTETLTNKTLTSPAINTPTIATPTVSTEVVMAEISTPDTPSTGYAKLYFKTDGLYMRDDGGTETQISSLGTAVPAGVVSPYAGTTAPTGYLMCDGAPVSRATYAALFTAIATGYGTGDGSTTFNLPDFRGLFLRGVAASDATGSGTASSSNATFTAHGLNRTGMRVRLSSGTLSGLSGSTDYYLIYVDANTLAFATSRANALAGTKIAITGANSAVIKQWEDTDATTRVKSAAGSNTTGIGSFQDDQNIAHTHTSNDASDKNGQAASGAGASPLWFNTTIQSTTSSSGGTQSNPRNVAVNYIIKT